MKHTPWPHVALATEQPGRTLPLGDKDTFSHSLIQAEVDPKKRQHRGHCIRDCSLRLQDLFDAVDRQTNRQQHAGPLRKETRAHEDGGSFGVQACSQAL